MAGQDEMKTDATLTWNLLRVNLPTIFAIAGVGLYINNGLRDAAKTNEALALSVSQIQQSMPNMVNLEYRVTRVEGHANDAHTKVDNLSNTMINNMDMMRRDLNRSTTQIEVLVTKVDMLVGLDAKDPVQRRSRPGGPIPAE